MHLVCYTVAVAAFWNVGSGTKLNDFVFGRHRLNCQTFFLKVIKNHVIQFNVREWSGPRIEASIVFNLNQLHQWVMSVSNDFGGWPMHCCKKPFSSYKQSVLIAWYVLFNNEVRCALILKAQRMQLWLELFSGFEQCIHKLTMTIGNWFCYDRIAKCLGIIECFINKSRREDFALRNWKAFEL